MAVAVCVTVAATAQTLEPAGVVTGGVADYTIARGDTLRGIAARFGVDVATLAADNRLDAAARLAIGQVLRIDNRHIVPRGLDAGTVVINIPQRMLFFDDGTGAAAFPVAVGRRDWQTPLGPFTILITETDPTWDVPASIQEEARRSGRSLPAKVPPGPQNPLGKFWLGLSIPGVGIHGTNAPSSIYGAVTHGCIRMHPDDVAWLFPRVQAGTPGLVRYQPVLLAVVNGDILLEAHRDVYRRADREPRSEARALAEALGLTAWIDWEKADDLLARRPGAARPVAKPGFSAVAPGNSSAVQD